MGLCFDFYFDFSPVNYYFISVTRQRTLKMSNLRRATPVVKINE